MESGEGAMLPPQKIFENFMQKIVHFDAKYSLVLRCICHCLQGSSSGTILG